MGGQRKVKKLIIFLFSASLISASCASKFGYPLEGEGWYSIQAGFSTGDHLENGSWEITRVLVNGKRIRDFLLFKGGKEVFDKKIMAPASFKLKIRYSWEGDTEYDIKAELKNTATGKTASLEKKMKSPSRTGYWDPRWKNYLSLLVSEENGYKRMGYPIQATVGILSEYLHSPQEIRVVKAAQRGNDVIYTEIPYQVYDVIPWADTKLLSTEEIDENTGTRIERYHPTTTLSIAFQADIESYEKATYLVFFNNPEAEERSFESDLQVRGDRLAKTIENSFYKVVLDKTSGMVTEFYEKETGIKLEHKLETNGAVHWNPGVYSPPHMWSHCSDWQNPSFSEVKGPVFYSLRRTAPLPHLQDVVASITYRFYRNSPFILTESIMEIKNDLFVKALRHGEVVFNKEVFDKAAYKTFFRKVNVIDFEQTRMHPDHVKTLRPDTPWIAFFNREKNIAFSCLFLDFSAANLEGGEASVQQPYIYIQHGPWYYLSRAFVYSFGSNNQSRMLPVRKGSVYTEKTAWIAFPFKTEGYFSHIDAFYNMLKYPLAVAEEQETYPESPEGWLVPILTEPFEEGVKDALGGKKKK
jgi:hypothetical protein